MGKEILIRRGMWMISIIFLLGVLIGFLVGKVWG
jgi:hypothetical protein